MRHPSTIVLVVLCAALPAGAARALDNVDTYICPTQARGSGLDCFLEAVPQTYTMCRNVKHIEIIEFGITGAQEGVNGAKTESCIDKHKLTITRPYQAALREAARNGDEVRSLRRLYDTWLQSLAKLRPETGESNEGYLQRVARPYREFAEQITGIRALDQSTVAAAPQTRPAAKAKSPTKQ